MPGVYTYYSFIRTSLVQSSSTHVVLIAIHDTRKFMVLLTCLPYPFLFSADSSLTGLTHTFLLVRATDIYRVLNASNFVFNFYYLFYEFVGRDTGRQLVPHSLCWVHILSAAEKNECRRVAVLDCGGTYFWVSRVNFCL